MIDEEIFNRIDDIAEQAALIISVTSEIDYNTFINDPIRSAAVIRFFEIIGEASRNVLHFYAQAETEFPEIPWRKLLNLRNILIHDYPSANLRLIWKFSVEEIPHLIDDIKTMKKSLLSDNGF